MKRALILAVVLSVVSSEAFADDFIREGSGLKRTAKDELEGKSPPKLEVDGWLNTDKKTLTLKQFEGKVVLLDFWGVWCPPCRKAIPHLKKLFETHKDQGLVVIGVHTTRQGEKAPQYVEEQEIPYPIAVDVDRKTVTAFRVDSYPDYYLIDRKGNLRFADLKNSEVDRALEELLKEKE